MRLHQLLENREPLNEGKTVAVKWYDEFDSGHVVHIGDNTLSLNGAEVNKNFQWDRPKGHAFSTAESYVSEWMYKMAKDWNDVHAYLKRARDTGNEQTLLTAVQKTFDTASMQPKIVEGSMVNGKDMDGEKRWKQTSLSPEEAIAKYGKENVRVKKGALRNGDDMVSVLSEETVKYEDHYDSRVVLTIEKDKLLYNGNPIQNYDWNSSAKDIISDKFYARAKSWKEVHGYLVRFLDNPKGLQSAVRQVFNTNDEGIQVNETVMVSEAQFDEAAGEKDACYHKVKSRYKVWPSAYASGALVKCRKVGAKNWGNSKK
jgi:hypothetical protein